ncbi:MAG TPA: V-type ATPase subunit [Terriglobales bacterium]|nr:V-type ATPase subunit [Terriglobales bacterium]
MTGSAGRYAELAAAVRSFKAELLQPNQYERFLETGSLSETVSMITAGHITSVEESDLNPVEAYLIERITQLTQRLAAYAPYDSKQLITLFSTGFEYACIKEILKAIAEQVSPEEALKHIIPAGRLTSDRCKDLIETHNPTRVLEMIDDEGLRRFVAPRLTGDKGGLQAASTIDQYYYARLWAASNLPDPLDTQSAKGLIGQLIDHANILLALRARLIGLDARSASDLLIPVNYALGHAFSELPDATNVQNVARTLEKTPYGNSFETSALLDGKAVERALLRSHAATCLNAFAGSPFNVGLALAFFFLKNYELRDIFSLLNGKANNAPSDQVLDSLILRKFSA